MAVFDLPVDMVIEILVRLPVSSLLRFKSVNKAWYFFIKSPTFAYKHLTQSSLNLNNPFSAVFTLCDDGNFNKHSFNLNFIEALNKPVHVDFPSLNSPCTESTEYELLGICNGLVCFLWHDMYYDAGLFLFNPTITEVKEIPGFEIPFIHDSDFDYFGFGFHSGRYILMRIVHTLNTMGDPDRRSELYSFTTNTWSEIRDFKYDFHCLSKTNLKNGNISNRKRPYRFNSSPILSLGVFYWKHKYDARVLSFNISTNFYDEISVPVADLTTLWHLRELFNEEVTVVTYRGLREFDVWVLSVSERSWTKKLCIEVEKITNWPNALPESEVTVLGCARTGELVLEDHSGKCMKLFLYDSVTKEIERLPYAYDSRFDYFLFSPSFITVKTIEEAEVKLSRKPLWRSEKKSLPLFPLNRPKTVPASLEIQALASQPAPTELVMYDNIFKKLLSSTDVKRRLYVPYDYAKAHFPHVDENSFVWVELYDHDQAKKIRWKLIIHDRQPTFIGNWKRYVEENELQKGDSVQFYIMRRGQIVNSECPRYAVKIEKAGETTGPRLPLAITFKNKALEGPISMLDMMD